MIYNTSTNDNERVVIIVFYLRETLFGGKSYNTIMNGLSSYKEEMSCRLYRYNYKVQKTNKFAF